VTVANTSDTLHQQRLSEVAENLKRLIDPAVYGVQSPIARAMELVGDKYSLQIIYTLYQMNRQRFVELEQQIEGISPRTLSARLKHLEKYGLISRHQYPTIPPKVEYDLTERGRDLANVLNAVEIWVDKWFPFVPEKR
jgi:DNA-binding HxlR family transcriptional regulator